MALHGYVLRLHLTVGAHNYPIWYSRCDESNQPIETKEYDPKLEFISREQRPEWNIVGLIGKVFIKKGSPINPNWIFLKDANEEADLYLIK